MAARKRATPPVSVLVPFREDGPDRAAAWAYLQSVWAQTHPSWQLVEGQCEGVEWRKGVAVADALSRASGQILVVADADVWCNGVPEAVERVAAGAAWAIPHSRVLRLTPGATAEVYASGHWPRVRTATTYMQRPYMGRPGGGIVVLPRDLYVAAPIDPRFAGWGQEDDSWALALRMVAGREWRGTEDLWHLWHRSQARRSRQVGNQAGAMLWKRYVRARDRTRMLALLAEVTEPAEVAAA